jgi:hypothetical protein
MLECSYIPNITKPHSTIFNKFVDKSENSLKDVKVPGQIWLAHWFKKSHNLVDNGTMCQDISIMFCKTSVCVYGDDYAVKQG